MDAYVYQAALICEDCADCIVEELMDFVGPQGREDSETWPQGPYADGGGEADSPQHCDNCGLFLENPLTSYGWDEVQACLKEVRGRESDVELEWKEFYRP